jgi:hypothetical protein
MAQDQLTAAYDALRNADAAGDHASAQRIADYIKSQQQPAQPQEQKPSLRQQVEQAIPRTQDTSGQAEPQTLGGAAKEIGGATAMGAIAGAATPEILMGVGRGVSALGGVFPPAAPAGAAITGAGVAMKGVRAATAASGALSGLVSETSGQIAEQMGVTKTEANLIRFGTGMLSPSATALVGFVSKGAKTAWNLATRLAGAEASIPKAVEGARKALATPAMSGQPQHDLYDAISQGVQHDLAAADAAAKTAMSEAHARAATIARTDEAAARRIVDDARAHGDSLRAEALKRGEVLNKATNGKLATAGRVKALADKELTTVGTPREVSDIGNELRQSVVGAQADAVKARAAQYQQVEQSRNAAVKEKEAQGLFIDSLPETKALQAEIDKKLLITDKGRAAAKGKAEVTEPGVVNAYRKVYDAISNRNVDGQTFRTTFEAVDHVRRKLGDVAFGKEAEGYAGLGQKVAADLYRKISNIQEQYAGPAQRELQEGYTAATAGLGKFRGAAGKKLTAADRMDAEAFVKDPSSIPSSFFKSQQGVKDLQELTGDPKLVERAARDYVARQLQGKSAAQAQAWLKAPAQTDWMREVPGVAFTADKYARKLAQIERVEGALSKKAEALKAQRVELGPKAEAAAAKELAGATERAQKAAEGTVKTQERVLEAGQKAAAGELEKAAPVQKLADLLKKGEKPEVARSLLLTANPEQTRQAAKYLAATPGGQKALNDTARNVMKNMGEKELDKTWNERLKPMLTDGKMLPQAAIEKLDADVQKVLKAYAGPQKVTMVQRLVAAALGAAAGTAVVEGGREVGR